MKRKIIEKFIEWKKSDKRKPLLLKGARQTGKTYCLEEFGQNFFSQYHCFDFMKNPEFSSIFERNLKPSRIIRDLSLITDCEINLTKDLIIFDDKDATTSIHQGNTADSIAVSINVFDKNDNNLLANPFVSIHDRTLYIGDINFSFEQFEFIKAWSMISLRLLSLSW